MAVNEFLLTLCLLSLILYSVTLNHIIYFRDIIIPKKKLYEIPFTVSIKPVNQSRLGGVVTTISKHD